MPTFTHLRRVLAALHGSRQIEADRMIRRHWRLVEEAHAYDRRCAAEVAGARTAAAPARGGLQLVGLSGRAPCRSDYTSC